MVKVPPVPSSLADTFLVSGGAAIAFLHLPVELDGASSTVAQHSEEVRLPEWALELLPDLVFLFPPGVPKMSGKLIHEHLWGRRTEPLSVRRGAEIARRADRGEAHEQFTQLRSSPER